jgi:hypothetical protein
VLGLAVGLPAAARLAVGEAVAATLALAAGWTAWPALELQAADAAAMPPSAAAAIMRRRWRGNDVIAAPLW